MRTTLNVDDDVLDVAKSMAHVRKMSVGEALSELARRGMTAPVTFKRDPDTGFLMFDGIDFPNITPEDIKRLEEEDDLEYYRRSLSFGSGAGDQERGIEAKKVDDKR
ncbi:MAG: hypothetical protein ABI824_02725 [Acidobacteriota bacterium]